MNPNGLLIPESQIQAPPDDPAGRDGWSTRSSLVGAIGRHYGLERFDLDVAASAHNAKAACFFEVCDNALVKRWKLSQTRQITMFDVLARGGPHRIGQRAWMNPPFTQILEWVIKALAEMQARDSLLHSVTGVLPARTDRDWHRLLTSPQAGLLVRVDYIEGRVDFDPPPGVKASQPREPMMAYSIGRVLPSFKEIEGAA